LKRGCGALSSAVPAIGGGNGAVIDHLAPAAMRLGDLIPGKTGRDRGTTA
jgi:hypothetical protein